MPWQLTKTRNRNRTSRIAPAAAVPLAVSLLVALPAADAADAGGAAPVAPAAVAATLLPVPYTGPGQAQAVRTADVTETGVVAGTAEITGTAPDGTPEFRTSAHRWFRLAGSGWRRQELPAPAGAASASVAALTELGEGAGAVVSDGSQRAVRWSVDGRRVTTIGPPGSRSGAVGPLGTWGVDRDTAVFPPVTGETELVSRGGARTPLDGTPELQNGFRRSTISVGGPRTAVVAVRSGAGSGTMIRPVLYRAGATLDLGVFSSPLGPRACTSRVRNDGTLVYSGIRTGDGEPAAVLVRHVGGVPGRDVVLARNTAADGVSARLACDVELRSTDVLAPDGGVAGAVTDQGGTRVRAAYWSGRGARTVVPLAPGESRAVGAAVATGGRMVVRADGDDGVARLFLWDEGTRTALTLPAGRTLDAVVELTEAGVVAADARDAAGTVVPAVWQVPRRTG
jgi:hypothetical protein